MKKKGMSGILVFLLSFTLLPGAAWSEDLMKEGAKLWGLYNQQMRNAGIAPGAF